LWLVGCDEVVEGHVQFAGSGCGVVGHFGREEKQKHMARLRFVDVFGCVRFFKYIFTLLFALLFFWFSLNLHFMLTLIFTFSF
jgi:hypothetical protein